MQPVGAPDLRDTIAAMFRQPAYDRELRETVWRRIADAIARGWNWLGEHLRDDPVTTWTLFALIALLIAAVIGRHIWLERIRRGSDMGRIGTGAAGSDGWAEAHRLAAAGAYTEAAHALYRALIHQLARRGDVRAHPAKTVGDYAREMRRRAGAPLARYRDFARDYETVVYRLGSCDAEHWERLRLAASAVVQTRD